MIGLTSEHEAARAAFRAFAESELGPVAQQIHTSQTTPRPVVDAIVKAGLLGLSLPAAAGGGGKDMVTLGLLAGELGRVCSSVRSLLTVHGMVGHTILRWGNAAQKELMLPKLASGQLIGALALSEPEAGSDAQSVTTSIVEDESGYVLDGRKAWVTYGQLADVFLVFGRTEHGPTAVLVERTRPGVQVDPILDLSGIRGSMTASVRFSDCRIPRENLVGRPGMGVSHVASSALDLGRYTVAWGSVGIIEACLEACVAYTSRRKQFGSLLKDHQLVRRMITNMASDLAAARLLCVEAGVLRDARAPTAIAAATTAKYFASTAAVRAAIDAVQLHGANGCSGDYPLQRYLGDAKVMEIIEGSTEIQQITIAEYAYQEYAGSKIRGGDATWRR